MQVTVGTYRVLFCDGFTAVVPLSKYSKLKEPTIYSEDSKVPEYVKRYIRYHGQYIGYIYLLHFDRPYHHARHYLGYTRDVRLRELRHKAGRGARLLDVLNQNGIGWTVSKVWVGDRYTERHMKKTHHYLKECRCCKSKHQT